MLSMTKQQVVGHGNEDVYLRHMHPRKLPGVMSRSNDHGVMIRPDDRLPVPEGPPLLFADRECFLIEI